MKQPRDNIDLDTGRLVASDHPLVNEDPTNFYPEQYLLQCLHRRLMSVYKFTLHMRRKVEKKESTRPFVFLYKVDFPDMEPKRIRLPETFDELLTQATKKLHLGRPAKQVFDDDGNAFTDIESIPSMCPLYISCAERPVADDEQPLYRSRLPLKPAKATLNLPPVKQPKAKPKPEDAAQHQAIASSPFTVRENMRNSLITLFCSLTPEQKGALPATPALQKLISDVQQQKFEHQLLSQFIGSSSIWQSEYGKVVTTHAVDKMKGLKPNDCKFLIIGPRHSGKSTLLNAAATVFFQKLQISGDLGNYLLFPVNWELHQMLLDDFAKIYRLYIVTTMTGLRNARMDLLKVIDALEQWFLSIITIQGVPLFPPALLHAENFPKELITGIGQRVSKAWSSKKDFSGFVEMTLALPKEIAHAFGLKNVVYIFDHLDVADVVAQSPRHFTNAHQQVTLADVLCGEIAQAPYFIAAKDDAALFDMFTLTDFRQLSTERILEPKEKREILIADPSLVVSYEMCHGCPAYCAQFDRVYEFVKTNQKNLKTEFTKLRSVVMTSRKEQVRQEVSRLCFLLAQTDTDDIINDDVLSDLQDSRELEVRIR